MPSKRAHPFARSALPSDIGARLKSARSEIGATRNQVAAAAGISSRTLARIERGDQRPTPATLRALARAVDMDVSDLSQAWGRDEDERPIAGGAAPGVAVRVLRRRCGLTIAQVAAVVGVSVATLSRFERGLHAPRGITAAGDSANGARGLDELAVTSEALAEVLGFASSFDLTRACADIDADD